MKKKLLWCIGIVAVIALISWGAFRYVGVRHRQADPNWRLAEQIYSIEKALKEVDEDFQCESISKVTPYTYADPDGNTIVYYCCQTTYMEDVYGDDAGLNTEALGMVIDFSQIENRRSCKVKEYDAFQCEMGGRSYLCWTISPELSCIIEYSENVNTEAEILRMAESVQPPA